MALIRHEFYYEPKPEYPLAMAYINPAWTLVRTEIAGEGVDSESLKDKIVFRHYVKPTEESK